MEVNVNVTVELGPKTMGLLVGGITVPEATVKAAPSKAAEAPKEEKAPKAEKTAASVKETKPVKEDKTGFEDLDDDAKLEAIKTEVTKHTKKGKSADIKALLTHFDAGRASELSTEQYGEFYAAIQRYGKGETVEAITGGDLN